MTKSKARIGQIVFGESLGYFIRPLEAPNNCVFLPPKDGVPLGDLPEIEGYSPDDLVVFDLENDGEFASNIAKLTEDPELLKRLDEARREKLNQVQIVKGGKERI